MKFSTEQIVYLKDVFSSLKLDETTSVTIIEAITKKETKKETKKDKVETCSATTKNGTRCTKKSKEENLCTIHLKSTKPPKVEKSKEFVVDDLSDEDKKKEIEALFEGV